MRSLFAGAFLPWGKERWCCLLGCAGGRTPGSGFIQRRTDLVNFRELHDHIVEHLAQLTSKSCSIFLHPLLLLGSIARLFRAGWFLTSLRGGLLILVTAEVEHWLGGWASGVCSIPVGDRCTFRFII